MEAGSTTATEIQHSWEVLTGEARDSWQFLGKEPEGVQAKPAESAGGESVSGATRRMAVQQLEALRHQVLTRAL